MNSQYEDKIDKVINYIDNNLSEKINLSILAEVSNFSQYHFSRIFNSVLGESPMSYVTRKRLERSVYYLRKTHMSILEISNICGFTSISSFNSAFKKHFSMTPSEIRKISGKISNFSSKLSNNQEVIEPSICYNKGGNNNLMRRVWDMNISIEKLPEYEVAYIRHVGSYLDTRKTWEKLTQWAVKNNILQTKQYFIGISQDDPNIVQEHVCRYDACVTIPLEFHKEDYDGVKFKKLSEGMYALYKFYDTNDKFALAYQSIFGQWLPKSDYDLDARECLEFCMNNPFDDPEGKCRVDLYIPIKDKE